MDEVWTLIVLSLAMLLGCYAAGSVPLAFSFSENKLKLVTILGAGLLVGTALAVIIPEGVHALMPSSHDEPSGSGKTGAEHDTSKLHAAAHAHEGAMLHEEHEHLSDVHSWIGVALVLGFVFMLLIDQIGGSIHARTSSSTDLSLGGGRSKITATVGLVVHAAADGIALGAAASTSHTDVEFIVFVAIMLHKAPAAFGLVSFLMHDGLDRTQIRKHLAVFALSAPIMAIVTYFGLSQGSKEVLSRMNATGIAMLFSGGTFLYVATVHILPELVHPHSSSSNSPDSASSHRGFTRQELVTMVVGCLLPVILAVGHKH